MWKRKPKDAAKRRSRNTGCRARIIRNGYEDRWIVLFKGETSAEARERAYRTFNPNEAH